MFRPLRSLAREPEGKVLLASAALVIAVGTIVYMTLEGWSPVDALYFSVVALATVGFGDLTPTTDGAKLFTVGYILAGVGIIAGFASELAKHRGLPPPMAHRLNVPPDESVLGLEEPESRPEA
jgi:hypothetical protein